MVSLSNHLSGDLKERAETNMLAYDEKVTIKYRDGGVVGGCRMIGWVDGDAGSRRWHGELMPIAGQPWEFAVASIEGVGLQVECADGATARILPPTVTDALSSGVRCTFEGSLAAAQAGGLAALSEIIHSVC